jgi:hypothetical protein
VKWIGKADLVESPKPRCQEVIKVLVIRKRATLHEGPRFSAICDKIRTYYSRLHPVTSHEQAMAGARPARFRITEPLSGHHADDARGAGFGFRRRQRERTAPAFDCRYLSFRATCQTRAHRFVQVLHLQFSRCPANVGIQLERIIPANYEECQRQQPKVCARRRQSGEADTDAKSAFIDRPPCSKNKRNFRVVFAWRGWI